mgnify:CR=1 FL=1
MNSISQQRVLSQDNIRQYLVYLYEQERAVQTIQKYQRDLLSCSVFLAGKELTKERLLAWKETLIRHYAAASVNAILASLNGFVSFFGWQDLKMKPLRIQKQIFCDAGKELTKTEYIRLVQAAGARGNERLSLILQTICGTGIRVSELRFITAEAVWTGRAEVACKGKRRTVFLPDQLRRILKRYLEKQGRKNGPVFVTRTGKPLDRSNIWRDMKALCERAGVERGKVFPHNLRHLFARTFYSLEKDLSRLADILGHSSVSTTRIYTVESGWVHEQQLGRMGLVLTT